MTYQQLLQLFKENSSATYDNFNRKIVNSGVPTIGCTVPFVRKVAKQYSLEDALDLPVGEFFEVDLLRGIVVSTAKLPFEEKQQHLTDFANTIENWAVCDCCKVNVTTDKEKYFLYFCNLCLSAQPFVCRYGLVNLLSFLDETHIVRVFDLLCRVKTFGHYYVDMAAAWLVATAMVTCRDQTVEFMEGKGRNVLNKFTYNKALQKMRDSYRVGLQDKAWTKTLVR